MVLPIDVEPDNDALSMLPHMPPRLQNKVKVERISADGNPLVKATKKASQQLTTARCRENQMRFLTQRGPFIVVSRKTRDWRKEQ